MTDTRLLDNIKKFARLRGMSLSQVGQKAGMASTALYEWGTVSPQAANVAAVAHVLGVTVDELTGTPSHVAAAMSYDIAAMLSDPDTQLLYKGRTLDQRDRDTIGRVLDR